MNNSCIPPAITKLTHWLADRSYENLTKIIAYKTKGGAQKAMRLPDDFMQDANALLGGGTCFSITYWLYVQLCDLGYKPILLMGHKRIARNVHCALQLSLTNQDGETPLFFDPGYLLFNPLIIPAKQESKEYLLQPNQVKLHNRGSQLDLYTGTIPNYKLRFTFDMVGVSETDFKHWWQQSFAFEMMNYPVLNKLDSTNGIQYYFQKSNLMIRSASGSTMRVIPEEQKAQVLHEIFGISPQIIDTALQLLKA
jgi:hypothetical protein